MTPINKQVLREATDSERYWNLSDSERTAWMIDRAFALGVESCLRTSWTPSDPVRRRVITAARRTRSRKERS